MMTGKIMYVCMTLHRWDNCELSGCPASSFGGYNDGSIGFMPVYDDVDTLKEKYPDAEIMKVERMG
jgi:hypothetical protein